MNMTTDEEKLAAISTGDTVSWRENSEELSGSVNGFTLFRRDKLATHHVIIECGDGQKEKAIALSSIVARRREKGAGSGIISWR